MWIPPAYSPVSLPGLARAGLTRDPAARGRLAEVLEERFGNRTVALTDSGTSALGLGIRAALDVAGGARVVALPAYGCYDLLTGAEAAEAAVVFYDVDPKTLAPVRASFERACGCASLAVVAYLYGFPLDWDEIRAVTNRAGILVLEDAAQGVGTLWREASGGGLGDLTVLSFGRGKGWNGGGGGALLATREDRFHFGALGDPESGRARFAVTTLAQWVLARPGLYGIPARIPALGLGATHYRAPHAPREIPLHNARMALETRALSAREVTLRRANAARLMSGLENTDLVFPGPVPDGVPAYLRLPVLTPGRTPPAALGVYRGYPHSLPAAVGSGVSTVRVVDDAPVPGAEELGRCLATVPTHSRTPVERVVRGLRRAYALGISGNI